MKILLQKTNILKLAITSAMIFSISATIAQHSKIAYVNEAEVRQNYRLMLEYQQQFIRKLQQANADFSLKEKELDSLSQEKIYKAGRAKAESSDKRSLEKDKDKQLRRHMKHLEGIKTAYRKQVTTCNNNILDAINRIVKEENYSKWAPIEENTDTSNGHDITLQVLSLLN